MSQWSGFGEGLSKKNNNILPLSIVTRPMSGQMNKIKDIPWQKI